MWQSGSYVLAIRGHLHDSDTGCTKAMRSRTALQKMKAGLHSQNIEILPDASAFNFAIPDVPSDHSADE